MGPTSAVALESFASLGEFLKFLRRRAGLTQRELAHAVGYSDAEISRFEKNQRRPNQATVVARFLPALGLTREPELATHLVALAARPSPGAPAEAADNLPLALTSFIGREKELAEVGGRLAAERLLTLVGPAGAGKTRLALEAGAAQRGGWADGIRWFELAPVIEASQVPQTVADGLNVHEQRGRPLVQSLVDYLRSRRVLLILDNCEHLATACAQLAEAILRACPRVQILATSREALGLAGETLFPVPPLSLPEPIASRSDLPALLASEAVRLFVDRAIAGRPDFRLTAANGVAIAEICQQLDGLPLALELAAARTRALAPDEIVARLADRFQLLRDGRRTALPHQQTLLASIEWSYNLLTEAERTLFRRLSVFRGGWTLDAAEAVCAEDGLAPAEILDLLTRLVDKSLVLTALRGQAARYSFLETLRVFAWDRLAESGEVEAVRRWHTRFYIDLAKQVYYIPDQVRWPSHTLIESDNLRAALDWAFDGAADLGLQAAETLAWPWYLMGHMREVDERVERALKLTREKGSPRVQAVTLAHAGHVAWISGDYAAAEGRFRAAADLLQTLGNPAWSGLCLFLAGRMQVLRFGPGPGALALEAEGVTRARTGGRTTLLAGTLATYGGAVRAQGDLAGAWALEQEAIDLCRELGDQFQLAVCLGYAGYVALDRAETDLAEALFTESLKLLRQMGNHWMMAWRLDGFASLAVARGQGERAARLFGAAQALLDSGGAQLDVIDRHGYAERVAQARSQLGEPAFGRAWATGQALSPEAAVALALENAGGVV